MDDQRVDGPIELVLPAEARLVRIARLVASGVATTADYDVEEVEDLRIAVDEVCSALLEGGDGSPLMLGFEINDRVVTLVGTTGARGVAEFEAERLALSRQILAVVADDFDITTDHGQISVRVRKRGTGSVDG